MVVWKKPLYLSEKIKKKQKKILQSIERGKPLYHVTVIALATNPNNLFDLYDANELLQPYYKKREIVVLGIAEDMGTAKQLLCEMLEECVQNTGTDYIKEYFTAVR